MSDRQRELNFNDFLGFFRCSREFWLLARLGRGSPCLGRAQKGGSRKDPTTFTRTWFYHLKTDKTQKHGALNSCAFCSFWLFLVASGVSGCVWLCLVVSGCFWLFLVDSGCFWLFLVVSGCFWLFLHASGCFWFILVYSGCVWLILVVSGCF